MSLSALRHSAMTKAFNNHHLCFPEFHPTGVFTQRAQLPHCAFMTNIYTDMGILADTICKGVFFFACRHGHAALTKKKKILNLSSLQAEGEDNLKKMQLMELAILNGTYRDNNIKTRK